MKLNEVYSKSIKELIDSDLELADMNVYTDDYGTIKSVELQYKPKKEMTLNGSTSMDF